MAPHHKDIYGVLAQFETAADVYHACEKMRDRGFSKWDAYSPFPIHGLEKAMGLPQSKLPWIVGAVSLLCGGGGFALWSWMNGIDYQFIIAGKPFYSWPAYFLPAFECAMISGAATCLLGMMALNKLPQYYHSLFRSSAFSRATNDKFFIAVEAKDPKFDLETTPQLLKGLGASHVELVEE
jgi:hypothetical protein